MTAAFQRMNARMRRSMSSSPGNQGSRSSGHADLLLARPLEQAEHDVAGAVAAAVVEHGVERVEPLQRLVRVDVGELGGQALVDHRRAPSARYLDRLAGCLVGA